MKKSAVDKYSAFPVVVMVAITMVFGMALIFRVYRADRDLGVIRIAERQARLAAEAGAFYALNQMQDALKKFDRNPDRQALSKNYFSDSFEFDKWIKFGQKSTAAFRIIGIRKVAGKDKVSTPLINEELRFQIISEGRTGRHRYTTSAIMQVYDIAKTFASFASLDGYYYGNPIQPWIEKSESLEAFMKANSQIFEQKLIDRMGVCYDPEFLVKMFYHSSDDPFKPVPGKARFRSNFGLNWLRAGSSPCDGPIYCSTPIVVDSHVFKDPVQTALYFYRRGNSQPVINQGSSVIAINSSLRIQQAVDNFEGNNPAHLIVDCDSDEYSSFIPQWRPDFVYLRELAKKTGIYIDSEGKGYKDGNLIDVNYHPGENHLYSDSYKNANSTGWEQDELDCKHVVLSTDSKFEGYNNLSSENLIGTKLIFSERSVYLRGEIGSDLVIATPGHVFISGPTNIDSKLNLFLVAKLGTALSTVDLEEYIAEKDPEPAFVEAASEWIINALIYKPGAGIYTTTSRPQKSVALNFRRLFSGKSLKIQINGGVIGGNLQRWMDNMELDGLKVFWNPEAVERLPVRPLVANVLKMMTRPDISQLR